LSEFIHGDTRFLEDRTDWPFLGALEPIEQLCMFGLLGFREAWTRVATYFGSKSSRRDKEPLRLIDRSRPAYLHATDTDWRSEIYRVPPIGTSIHAPVEWSK
jgi:hypothetical protein